MSKQRKHSLKTFVHRVLVIRLVVAGLVISFVLGLAVFLSERNRVSESVISIALQRTSLYYSLPSVSMFTPGKVIHLLNTGLLLI
jgi:hypothetical protein